MIDMSEATFFGALTLRAELTEDKILNEEIQYWNNAINKSFEVLFPGKNYWL